MRQFKALHEPSIRSKRDAQLRNSPDSGTSESVGRTDRRARNAAQASAFPNGRVLGSGISHSCSKESRLRAALCVGESRISQRPQVKSLVTRLGVCICRFSTRAPSYVGSSAICRRKISSTAVGLSSAGSLRSAVRSGNVSTGSPGRKGALDRAPMDSNGFRTRSRIVLSLLRFSAHRAPPIGERDREMQACVVYHQNNRLKS